MGKRRKGNLAIFGVVLFSLWVAFVIAFYYVIHKPWWNQLSLAPFAMLLNIGLALAMVSLSGGVGRWVLHKMDEAHPLERIVLQAALGLGILGVAVMVLGFVGLISTWIAWLGLIVGLVLLRRDVIGWLSDFSALRVAHGEVNRLGQWALVFSSLLFGMNLLRALAPPLKWDSLVYHLQVPAQYVSAGRIFYYPENLYAGFPQVISSAVAPAGHALDSSCLTVII